MGEPPFSILCILFEPSQRSAPLKALLTQYLIDSRDLLFGDCIGEGSSSIVFKGQFKDQLVAIKQLKGVCHGGKAQGEFRREVLSLISCAHRNILKFYGTCVCPVRGICIVTKFMAGGSLHRYLQRKKSLKLKEILKLGKDVARGMEFLHSKGVVHMDLKTANVFLDEEGNAVIGDFGIARLVNEKLESETQPIVGTYTCMAPEVCEVVSEGGGSSFSFKSDVYSFGILLWELVTCKVPFAGYDPVQAAVAVVVHGVRPDIPSNCFPPLRYLIQKCWSQDPNARPHFPQIMSMLDIISSQQS